MSPAVPTGQQGQQRALRLVGAALAVPLLWAAVGATAANVVEPANAELALKFWPWDSSARARLAGKALADDAGDEPTRAEVERMAQSIARAEPINAVAFRLAGTVAAARGDEARADTLMRHVEQITRRDALSQFYLIERAVGAGDVQRAFGHYRKVLDTQPETFPALFPILVKAAAQPAILPDYARFLAAGRLWRDQLAFKIASETEPVTSAVALFKLTARQRYAVGPEVRRPLIDRLQTAGQYREALAQSRIARGDAGPVVNPDFGAPRALAPFDWTLASSADATVALGASNGRGLAINVTGSNDLVLARALLVAAPGRYRLSSTFALERGNADGMAWTLDCAGGGAIGQQAVAGQGGSRQSDITIPAQGCPAQWLALTVAGKRASEEIVGTIQSVRLLPIGGAPPAGARGAR